MHTVENREGGTWGSSNFFLKSFWGQVFWPKSQGGTPFWVLFKQWLLAGEFSEFEYSPEIHHFWRIRVLAKMVFLKNWSDSLNLPSFANLVCSDSPDSPTFANLVSSDSPDSRKPSFASNKRIWRIWRVWQI
jgi:hypothetical protein